MQAGRRRTQAERRETTIRRLLDAATDVLIDHGYAEASVQRICARAELSQGALFRHFATREALMVAVGEHVGARLLATYKKKFMALPRSEHGADDIASAIRLLRDACRSRLSMAWFELGIAGRTNPTLRKALDPVGRRYAQSIVRQARELLPALATRLGDSFDVVVDTLLAVFDGEVLHRLIVRNPELEDARLALVARGAEQLARSLGPA